MRLRGAEIDQKYSEGWQRVEAFRWLLRENAQNINGRQPTHETRILDIPALLTASSPHKDRLEKAKSDQQP